MGGAGPSCTGRSTRYTRTVVLVPRTEEGLESPSRTSSFVSEGLWTVRSLSALVVPSCRGVGSEQDPLQPP